MALIIFFLFDLGDVDEMQCLLLARKLGFIIFIALFFCPFVKSGFAHITAYALPFA